MKQITITLALLFTLGIAVNASTVISVIPDCEHCAKDHKCDDKCKKGEKSSCCAKAKGEENKEKAACCKKDAKSCKKEKEKSESKETKE